MAITTRALVAYEPENGHANFKLEEVTISRPVQPDEVLVRMVASGVCHTDLIFALAPAEAFGPFPKVLGHEGAGYVEEVGSNVTSVKKSDAVLCSFSSCSSCRDCRADHPAFCQSFNTLNYAGTPELYSQSSGHFFGQSSFSNLAVVRERSVVNVSNHIKSQDDLHLFAAMGCAFQTGAGTVENLCGCGPSDAVVILGLGGVGLAGIMAAKISGAQPIVGVDRFTDRLELAKSLGATHVINTADEATPTENLIEVVKEMTGGIGATIVVDTTGAMPLINAAINLIGHRGQMVILGVAPLDAELGLHLVSFMQTGKTVRGSIEGDVNPSIYIPKMIDWFRQGKFAIDKLIKTYPMEDYEKALEDMHRGATVKPVLLW